jgi:hypothetical protein
MLRTVELLVGIPPLTQFDAYSTPMTRAFSRRADPTPYTAQVPTMPLNERNAASAPLAAESGAQNLTVEDAIDEQTFNRAIWQSVHGANSVMPEPQHRFGHGRRGRRGRSAARRRRRRRRRTLSNPPAVVRRM